MLITRVSPLKFRIDSSPSISQMVKLNGALSNRKTNRRKQAPHGKRKRKVQIPKLMQCPDRTKYFPLLQEYQYTQEGLCNNCSQTRHYIDAYTVLFVIPVQEIMESYDYKLSLPTMCYAAYDDCCVWQRTSQWFKLCFTSKNLWGQHSTQLSLSLSQNIKGKPKVFLSWLLSIL